MNINNKNVFLNMLHVTL